ncbi:hypothetical protein WKK05_30600 [Nostoc sp. UHCC 0302]|uniref:hypothetical protein n=1 Tax=Nostoc sp. UHCC 0302 TaxID=3134896 RepID=UPI00311CDA3E
MQVRAIGLEMHNNNALTEIDSSLEEIRDLEKSLSDLSQRMLIGVAFKYGKDSYEYVMAGGVRKSDACGGLRIRRSTATRLKARAK